MSNSDPHQFKDRYMLRLPDGMRDRIKSAAEENSRSMNSEIIARLEASFLPSRAASYSSPDAGAILEGIFAYLTAEGWTPPSGEVTDRKTQRIIKERRTEKDGDPS